MPRPPRCRRICGAPQVDTFCPDGCGDREPILLTLDEYEVMRLVDLEQQTHEQCAAQMDISRSTVQEIYGAHGARSQLVLSTETAAHHRGKLPHLRRTRGSPLRPLLPDAESQHRKIQQKCKGESIMKIAVTYENGQIFQHFGHTEQFKLYEAADGKITMRKLLIPTAAVTAHWQAS